MRGLIGATKLHYSLSSQEPLLRNKIELVNKGGSLVPSWSANVFLFHFFCWIKNPLDIDGDGKATLLDSYKYAGAKTNIDLMEIKFSTGLDLRGKFEESKNKIRNHLLGKHKLSDIEFETAWNTADRESKLLYLHQEPWLLHADLIRSSIMF